VHGIGQHSGREQRSAKEEGVVAAICENIFCAFKRRTAAARIALFALSKDAAHHALMARK
jgi:hypothetical protein